MGSTSEWGQTVIDSALKPTEHPPTIDGMPMWDYVNMVRGKNVNNGVNLTPMQILLEGKRDEQHTRALSDQLRGRKELGELVSLVGTSNQKNFGQGLRADVLGQQQQKEKQDQRNMMQNYYDRAQTETARHNKAMEDYYNTRGNAQDRMVEKDFNTNVRRLSEKMTQMGIPELQYDVSRITESLQPYIDDPNKDIPGIGKTGMAPNMMVSDEAVGIRQGLAAVRNKLLKVRSGAAVTDPEMARFAQELITTMDTISTDRELRLTWPQVAAGIAQIEKGIEAGYPDEVVQTFKSRLGGQQTHALPQAVGSSPPQTNPDTGNQIIRHTYGSNL
jgi:hypothetical protein